MNGLIKQEQHLTFGLYLKDIIFAANDGIITTFAVISAVAGAELSATVILIVGLANIFADGFSMAAGNYLGTKSEIEFYRREEARERYEVETIPDKEREEIREILAKKGYQGRQLEDIVVLISGNKQYWIDFMMHEELGLYSREGDSPMKHGLATFISFVIAGSLPIWPYLLFGSQATFLSAIICSAVSLFVIGAWRKYFSGKSWVISGLEMLLVGGSAGAIAYFVGYLLKAIVS